MTIIPAPECSAVTAASVRIVRAVHYGGDCSVLTNFFRHTMTLSLVGRKLTAEDLDNMVSLGHTQPGATVATVHVGSMTAGQRITVTFTSTDVIDHEHVAFAIRQLMPRELNTDARRAYRAVYAQLRSTE